MQIQKAQANFHWKMSAMGTTNQWLNLQRPWA